MQNYCILFFISTFPNDNLTYFLNNTQYTIMDNIVTKNQPQQLHPVLITASWENMQSTITYGNVIALIIGYGLLVTTTALTEYKNRPSI